MKKLTKFTKRRDGSGARYDRCSNCPADRPVYDRKDIIYRHMFNLSLDDYNEMFADQGGRCAICGDPPSDARALAVDHDHSCCSGKRSCGGCVRGLLCIRCNTALGAFRDNPKYLEAALAYLAG